jgi:dihydrolipoamide dehydrogenase
MKFMMETKVIGGNVTGSGATIEVESVKTGEKQKLSADIVLVSTGRRPFTEGLNLAKAGLEANKFGRIEVNAQL